MVEDLMGRPAHIATHSVSFRARGMHCPGCEHIIEDSVRRLSGVRSVKADYPTETVKLVFDPELVRLEDVYSAIARKGYRCAPLDDVGRKHTILKRLAGFILGIAGIALIILLDTEYISKSGAPDISQHMSLGLIFLLGLLTGFHCVGMCGGFVLSYTAENPRLGKRSYLSHLSYGAGKTLSYTAIGAMFGLFGAVITFTPFLRGAAGVIAGIFLIIFGLNMLGLFAPLRKIQLKMPIWLWTFFGKQTRAHHRPFEIGLLNGLMIACGPLQAMYVMAAGTGSAVEGAKMLFAFGVGTLPVMLSFGMLTSLISGALTHKLLMASGAIVITLGAVMINRGLILTGTGYDLHSVISLMSRPQSQAVSPTQATASRPAVQTIVMDVMSFGYTPNQFTLIKDVPVKWIINGKEVTECNRRILVPKLGLQIDVKEGEQVIEFTPKEEGIIPWSCWMGMKHGEFIVINGPLPAAQAPVVAANEPPGRPAGAPPSAAQTPKAIANEPPGRATEAPPPVRSETYTIAAGDSFSRIAARQYDDERQWRAIAKANPGLNPRRLRAGEVIQLPRPVSSR
jgi:uncharacterized protein